MLTLDALLEQHDAWSALVPHLAGLTEEACRALGKRLDLWPDDEREVPSAWIDRAVAGDPPAALELCRSLSLAHHSFGEDDDLDALLRLPALAGLTQLTLGTDARSLTAARLAGLVALRELRIETTEPFTSAIRDAQLAEIAATPLACLTLLSFNYVHLSGPGVAALAGSTTLPALTTLELYGPASEAVCAALATRPAPALRGVRRLALCADHFTVAAADALVRADDLLADLHTLEFRVDESSGFDWAEPFSDDEGAANAQRLAKALARLLPELRDCERVTISYSPRSQVVHLGRADFKRLARKPRALRAAFPPRMTDDL